MTAHPSWVSLRQPACELILVGEPSVALATMEKLLRQEWFRVEHLENPPLLRALVGSDFSLLVDWLRLVPGKAGRLGTSGEVIVACGPPGFAGDVRLVGETHTAITGDQSFGLLISLRTVRVSGAFRLQPLFLRLLDDAVRAFREQGVLLEVGALTSAFDLPLESVGYGQY